jgi:[acyl-carrier-protein] S-malonyltransferase
MNKQTALVICPGRGTYNKDELGYLQRYHADKSDFMNEVDRIRAAQGQPPIRELDGAEKFGAGTHMTGDNASALIYACAYADFLSINPDKFDVVAVTGNSMGWYIALACAGAASAEDAAEIVNTMGTLMHKNASGGQVLYTYVDENWMPIPGKREELLHLIEEIEDLYLSIELGGMVVFAGSDDALEMVMKKLPPVQNRFPMRLMYHGAFHTELMASIAKQGQSALGGELFTQPAIPMIDGRGHIWSPYSTDKTALRDYTLDIQVCETYHFTRAVQVAMKEFVPDKIIIPGPGTTLGGAVAQSLLEINWQGMRTKEDFSARQKNDPLILSMGMEEQRKLVV